MKVFKFISISLAIMLLLWGGLAGSVRTQAAPAEPTVDDLPQLPTDQLIIKYRDVTYAALAGPDQANEIARLSAAAGVELAYFRSMSGEAHVLKLPQALPESEVAVIAAKLAALPDVAYAEPDAVMVSLDTTPNDPEYASQWHYLQPAGDHYGVDAPRAWDITKGSADLRVAVLDTGITDHPDLAGRWVGGYDFISDAFMGNDGDGRDANPHDAGDWLTVGECGGGYPPSPQDSSWHGTHVAGTIGAASNNGVGVAGINWNSMILPVRVLGKCGGMTSDIADGMRWAAGLAVSGVPNNTYPAKVLNLSLGGQGACTSTYQDAVNAIVAAGTTIVISSGNSNADSSGYRPGNCNGVITVAATNRTGGRAYYSNYGSVVEIAAPGGAQSYENDPNGVLSTLNDGATSPANPNYEYYQGTSMAAPHVAGVVSLLYSVDPSLTPAEVLTILQTSATSFPAGSSCNTSICGSGIANAYAAVMKVANIPATPVFPSINNADGDGSYRITWSKGATSLQSDQPAAISDTDAVYKVYLPLMQKNFDGTVYTLQEDDNSAFTSPTDVYKDTGTSINVTGKAPGTYYYRVRAGNTKGNSSWSGTQSVTVSGAPSVWTNITTLDFEGSFPGAWQVIDNDTLSGEYFWAKSNCKTHAGSYSGWAVGGGAQGSGLTCGSNYPNNADSWMVYGPFDLSTATAAQLSFSLWTNTEDIWDEVCYMASLDGNQFYGSCSSGMTAGWEAKVLDLTNVYSLGDVTGESQVWVALQFISDSSAVFSEGVYVDDILLRKCSGTCTTAAASAINTGFEFERQANKKIK